MFMRVREGLCLIALAAALSGCGGGSSTASTAGASSSGDSSAIVGVATPSSVSVVTATNAN